MILAVVLALATLGGSSAPGAPPWPLLPADADAYDPHRAPGPGAYDPPEIESSSISEQSHVYTGMGNGTTDVERWESLIVIHFPDETGRAWARRVMACESGGNKFAENQTSSASGLFQFLDSTWAAARVAAGHPHADIYDGADHIRVAAWWYYNVGPSQWSCK